MVIAAVTAFVVLRSSIAPMPNIGAQSGMLADPFSNPYPTDQSYIWWNWLSPFIAHLIGLRSSEEYSFFCLVIGLAILPCCYLALRSHIATHAAVSWRLLLVACFPASFTGLFWVGMDSLTIVLLVLVVAARRRPVLSAALGILCGLQHAEQASVAIGLLVVGCLLLDRPAVRSALAAFVGVVTGRLILTVIAAHAGGAPLQTRYDYFFPRRGEFLHQFISHAPTIIWSIFGAGWLVLLATRLGRRTVGLLVLAVATALVLAMTSDDQTRVCAITTLPVLLLVFASPEFAASRLRSQLVLPVGLLLPAVWVWKGHNRVPWPYPFVS